MIGPMLHLISGLGPIVQSSSSEGSFMWLLAVGPAGAAGTYWAIYRYYRNHDKTHAYERDTLIDAKQVGGWDNKVDHIRKTQKSGISGDNTSKHRDRVNRVR